MSDEYRYDGDATDLCLDFSVEDDTFGARSVHSLVPGGSQVAVTDSNKLHYIHLAADWHLNGRLGASSAAFARGLAQVFYLPCLRLACAIRALMCVFGLCRAVLCCMCTVKLSFAVYAH